MSNVKNIGNTSKTEATLDTNETTEKPKISDITENCISTKSLFERTVNLLANTVRSEASRFWTQNRSSRFSPTISMRGEYLERKRIDLKSVFKNVFDTYDDRYPQLDESNFTYKGRKETISADRGTPDNLSKFLNEYEKGSTDSVKNLSHILRPELMDNLIEPFISEIKEENPDLLSNTSNASNYSFSLKIVVQNQNLIIKGEKEINWTKGDDPSVTHTLKGVCEFSIPLTCLEEPDMFKDALNDVQPKININLKPNGT